jgi:phosphoribosylformimino-5-aminoimidazole carboxamide ribotide isomerase
VLKRYHDVDGVTSDFVLLPAIDLRGGRVVRLRQGDFARETVFSDDPVSVARGFVGAGARWLHVVDLDGARAGASVQLAVIRAIADAVGDQAAIEVAGGLRDDDAVAKVLDLGAARAIIGTAALHDPSWVGRLIDRHGTAHIAVALDIRDGLAVGNAWRTGAGGEAAAGGLRRQAAAGVTTIEVTAIERDGSLDGPNLDLLASMVDIGRGTIIASAGIATLDDLRTVRAVGCSGAIVGRSLYEGELDLGAAIAAAETRQPTRPSAPPGDGPAVDRA